MSINICTDWDNNVQLLYCNTSDWAFGPVFYPNEDNYTAEDFLEWYQGPDLRTLTDSELSAKLGEFKARYIEQDQIAFSDVADAQVEGVDPNDSPDFCDAYFSYAVWADGDHKGKELTENELETLTDQNLDELNELAQESLREKADFAHDQYKERDIP